MTPDTPAPGSWDTPQNILVVLAHPDDPEFFCGATLARWVRQGHHVTYYLLTCGDKGYNDMTRIENVSPDDLCALRHKEQAAAAKVIGADEVFWLDRPDGYLVPDLDLRREVVRIIRRLRPNILVTCDPQTLFAAYGLNHPDHRAAGQAVLDAVFPAAGNAAYFPELITEGYQPHMPQEVWCSLTREPTVTLDVTDSWLIKLEAILQHKSQIADVDRFMVRMRSRHTEASTAEDPRYEEVFRVISYR
jgi:LmbE family N-acetylglucosaminyl deacetylase